MDPSGQDSAPRDLPSLHYEEGGRGIAHPGSDDGAGRENDGAEGEVEGRENGDGSCCYWCCNLVEGG